MSVNQRPRLHVAPAAVESFGDIAADFAADYELRPDEWQALILNDWLAIGADGLWASLNCGLACPRQNGKNAVLEVRELFGMVGRGEKILHTAHEVKTARKAFKRLQHFFGRQVHDPAAKFPELNRRVVELRNVNGQEAIFLENGGSVEIVARSKNSARGFTADVVVMDEAQEMSDDDIEALIPTTSSAPLGNPQWIFTGTPPGPKVNGEVFTRTRTTTLTGGDARSCWHEWSACDPGGVIDLDDRNLWMLANPRLDAGLLMSVVEGERAQFSDEGFARERLGVWSETDGGGRWLVVPQGAWLTCERVDHKHNGSLSYAVDADVNAQGETWVSIAASDGRHVEIVNPPEAGSGTAWAVPAILKRRNEVGELVIDSNGPAGVLVAPLEKAGMVLRKMSAAEVAQSSAQFLDAVVGGEVRHIDQPRLNTAAAGVERKDAGDGAWRFSRSRSGVDIGPLMACSFARWSALSLKPPVDAASNIW